MWPFSSLFGTPRWKVVAQAKKDARTRAIDEGLKLAGPATPQDSEYLSASAVTIAERIRNREWRAGEVVRAYIRRAALVQERCNALTEVRFVAAIQEADALDAKGSDAPRGRLAGVPVSIKDHFNVTGLDTTCGHSSWVGIPRPEEAAIVQLMKEEGAIVIAKTNVPHTLMFFEAVNPIFGRTTNPWNTAHAAGGSSGGEAVMLACDGSALGAGSDIGGSLRIPSFYCGTYALKPTFGRISGTGMPSTAPGFESVSLVCGPMGRTIADITLLSEITFGRTPTNSCNNKALRLGYYKTDGVILASPAVQRAVTQTIEALRAQGHELIELDVDELDMMRAIETFVGLSSADGYKTLLDNARSGGDPLQDELFLVTIGPKLPGFLRSFAGWLVAFITGDTQFRRALLAGRAKSTHEYFKLVAARDEFRGYWEREIWAKHRLDGIIAPQLATPAPPNGSTAMAPQMSAATFLYNVLEYPVGALPVTHVDAALDANTQPPKKSGNGVMTERPIYIGGFPGGERIYDAKKMSGLPVGIQVVGRRWEDEKVLGMMQVVEDALNAASGPGGRGFGPGKWKL